MSFKVGEVRVADDSDFTYFKNLCEDDADWRVDYNKNDIKVSSKDIEGIGFRMLKVKARFKVRAATVYDVLHDTLYRKLWDKNMIDGYELCSLNLNNDIGYYALRSLVPFKNRDFVTLRSWLATAADYVIINHSVFHKNAPPKKNFIRGLSHLTGYYMRPIDDNSCYCIYVTHCDPRGNLPSWAVNKASCFVAPRVTQRLMRACQKYDSWKSKHQPSYKPWLYPEQIEVPRLRPEDVLASADFEDSQLLDESNLCETSESDGLFQEEGATPLNGGDVNSELAAATDASNGNQDE